MQCLLNRTHSAHFIIQIIYPKVNDVAQQKGCLLPSLKTQVQTLGPTDGKQKTDSHKWFSSFSIHTNTHTGHTHNTHGTDILTHAHTQHTRDTEHTQNIHGTHIHMRACTHTHHTRDTHTLKINR